MSYTKGPWTAMYDASVSDGKPYLRGIFGRDGKTVVFGAITGTGSGHAECDANTVLAAAAPDLLAALTEAIAANVRDLQPNERAFGDDPVWLLNARAAIAKATK